MISRRAVVSIGLLSPGLVIACTSLGGLSGGDTATDAAADTTTDAAAEATADAGADAGCDGCVTADGGPEAGTLELSAALARVVLDVGDSKQLDLAVVRHGGLTGPVLIVVNHLPSGVNATALTIPGPDTTGSIELAAPSPVTIPLDVDLEIVGTLGNVTATAPVHLRLGSFITAAPPDGGSFQVPTGIDVLTFKLWGAGGGAAEGVQGGGGGYAQADVAVTPGEMLWLVVGRGGGGSTHNVGPNNTPGAGGGGCSAVVRGTT